MKTINEEILNEEETLISEEILDLLIGFEYLLESQSGEKFDIKHKILHLVSKRDKTNPNYLVEVLNMARSNLAIICNNMIKDGLLEKHKEENSKKEIFYVITVKGKELIESKFANTEKVLSKLRNKNKIRKTAQELTKMF